VPTASAFAVRTEGLGRAYDEHYALIGLDADFPPGSVTALLGPNGAGKSTLIGILSTLVRPSEGALFFGDTRLNGAKARAARRYVGYVGHRTMLYKPLTAKENLRFFGTLYRLDDLDARVDAALERVGLRGEDIERPIEGFSRGMTQRLTLARALLPEPQVLLLDEPLTGLDQAGIALALDLFKAAQARGAVVLVASHDLEAVGRIADRALILRRGRKRHLGAIAPDLATLYRESLAA
jgi:heme exporter protein A